MLAKRGLGSSATKHASHARDLISSAERHVQLARQGTCSLRFTSLMAADNNVGKAWAHAFQSGGRVAKGALTQKTLSTEDAKRLYDVNDDLHKAALSFERDCVKSGDSLSGRSAKRRGGARR